MTIDISFIGVALVEIIKVLPLTLILTFTPVFFGTLIGIGVAFLRIKERKVITPLVNFYVSFFRGTPVIMHIMLIYYGIPIVIDIISTKFNWSFSSTSIPILFFVMLALTLSAGAYLSEIIRSGILSVTKGQIEAASSIGMTVFQVMKRIIIPQALGKSIPNFTNVLIGYLHATSLAFLVSIKELTGVANIVASVNLKFLEAFIAVGIIYWAVSILIEIFAHFIEKKVMVYSKDGISQ